MKKSLLISFIVLSSITTAAEDIMGNLQEDSRNSMKALSESAKGYGKRWNGTFQMYHESDINVGRENVTDMVFVFRGDDTHTGMFYQYNLWTTSLTEDASERERNDFIIGKVNMFSVAGMYFTPYYTFRYETHNRGSIDDRIMHRVGYLGRHENGFAFEGFSSYERYDLRGQGPGQTGYFGNHELIYTKDFLNGFYIVPSIFNEYMTLNDISLNNTQARLEAGMRDPFPYMTKFGVFTEVDLHRQVTQRRNSGKNYEGTIYTFGIRCNTDINKSLGLWSEISYSNNAATSSTPNNAEQVYVETGMTYKF